MWARISRISPDAGPGLAHGVVAQTHQRALERAEVVIGLPQEVVLRAHGDERSMTAALGEIGARRRASSPRAGPRREPAGPASAPGLGLAIQARPERPRPLPCNRRPRTRASPSSQLALEADETAILVDLPARLTAVEVVVRVEGVRSGRRRRRGRHRRLPPPGVGRSAQARPRPDSAGSDCRLVERVDDDLGKPHLVLDRERCVPGRVAIPWSPSRTSPDRARWPSAGTPPCVWLPQLELDRIAGGHGQPLERRHQREVTRLEEDRPGGEVDGTPVPGSHLERISGPRGRGSRPG